MIKKSLRFRSVKVKDFDSILIVYNYYIKNSYSNFEEKKFKIDDFLLLYKEISSLKLPFVVCEFNKTIVGFAYLNTFRKKSGYRYTFENTIYIHPKFIGKGIGSLLLRKLIEKSKKINKIKSIIAVIGEKNSKSSIKIHKKNGFKVVGKLKKVGYKKKQWVNTIYMQKIVNEKN